MGGVHCMRSQQNQTHCQLSSTCVWVYIPAYVCVFRNIARFFILQLHLEWGALESVWWQNLKNWFLILLSLINSSSNRGPAGVSPFMYGQVYVSLYLPTCHSGKPAVSYFPIGNPISFGPWFPLSASVSAHTYAGTYYNGISSAKVYIIIDSKSVVELHVNYWLQQRNTAVIRATSCQILMVTPYLFSWGPSAFVNFENMHIICHRLWQPSKLSQHTS